MSTVNATFRGKSRLAAFAVWGAVASGAAALGPFLGGWITTSFSWPWIFLVNLPVAALIIVGALRWVPETKGENLLPGIDIVGVVLSGLGFAFIVFALVEGATLGWWKPKGEQHFLGITWSAEAPLSIVPILLVLGVALIVGFVLWENARTKAGRSALLDLSLFTVPTFRWGNLTAAVVAIGEFGIVFVMPLYLVNVLDLDTMKAGLVIAAMAVGAFFSGAMARHLAAAIGAPRTVVVGLGLEVIGTGAAALFLGPTMSAWWIAVVLAIYGLGLGLASAQLTGTTLVHVPPNESGQGSAAQSTVRQLGSALGTAFVGAALASSLARSVPAALEKASIVGAEATKLTEATVDSAGSVISGMRAQGENDALVNALSDGFGVATSHALWVATGFLVVGLLSSILLTRATRDDKVAVTGDVDA